jgi:hypothetical protein
MTRLATLSRLLCTYRMPRFRMGQTVRCEVNGPVTTAVLSARLVLAVFY